MLGLTLSRLWFMQDRYRSVRQNSLELVACLELEDYVVQPHPEVSPPKWHLAHTTWFFENFLLKKLKNYQPFDPHFDELFNSYYKTQGEHWLQSQRGHLSRPTVDQVLAYRRHVDEALLAWLKVSPNKDLLKVLEVGIQHEQQHQELLLMDMKRILGQYPIFSKFTGPVSDHLKPLSKSCEWLAFPASEVQVGSQGLEFSFDNEEPRHPRHLGAFAASSRVVSNAEYLKFIQAGGYENPELWLSDGWDWVNQSQATAPMYWRNQSGTWMQYRLSDGLKSVELDQPVMHLNYYEADAFARFQGARLPTEFELEKLLTERVSIEGLGQLWLWSQSSYSAYPGYRQPEGAFGEYNGKFMVNQIVLRGGCLATPEGHFRASYRNFYRAHQSWAFTGLLLVKSVSSCT